jgi:hypothetical protein
LLLRNVTHNLLSSVWNTDPDPDPYVFGPPGSASGSVSHKYGSGSGLPSSSKNSQKNLDFYYFVLLYDFLYLKVDVIVPPVFRIRMFLGIKDPHPDPLVRGTDPRIRTCIQIHTKMSRIPNTASEAQVCFPPHSIIRVVSQAVHAL